MTDDDNNWPDYVPDEWVDTVLAELAVTADEQALAAEIRLIAQEHYQAVRARFAATYDPTLPVPCTACGRDMSVGLHGCDPSLTYPYGEEPAWLAYAADQRASGRLCEPLDECRDCGAPLGTFHHINCCVAYCWTCDEQYLVCEHGPHGDDDDWFDNLGDHFAEQAADWRRQAIERLRRRAGG